MSYNTWQRIFSTIVMVAIAVICIYMGKVTARILILVMGLFALDEIYCNFFKKKKGSLEYFLVMGLLLVPFLYFNFRAVNILYFDYAVWAALLVNGLLLLYLFITPMQSSVVVFIGRAFSPAASFFILFPCMSLTKLIHYPDWRYLIILLLVINFMMDTGAWFFGKRFGRHKLWRRVSPKKTIEGLLGGMLTSGVLGIVVCYFLFKCFFWWLIFLFMLLGLISQLGDLVQSKLKRQFNLKDSSSRIPGHGGFYDRIDSLIFMVPFYVIAVGAWQG